MRIVPALCAIAMIPVAAAAQGAVSLQETLCGRTLHAYYGGGNQIEYMRADGQSFFWQYGRSDVVEGEWWVQTAESGSESVCFRYAAGAFSPASPLAEHCIDGAFFLANIGTDGMVDGDPYDLQSGAAPYYLIPWPRLPATRLAEQFSQQPRDGACGAVFM